ncbi:MAG: nitroreductase family protein [Pirellulales bacterium]|nr:nitroreductase family protein [Pirellulales bacterium]
MRAPVQHPVHDFVAERWSPYVFEERSIPAADLRALFEAARWAPSSYNEQPWRFIVGTRDEPELFQKVLSCLVEGNQAWAKHTSALAIGVVSEKFVKNGKPNAACEHDLGLAAATLSLEATSRGIAVHQMIGILPDRARELFQIPEGYHALTGIALGYEGKPQDRPELAERDRERRPRRPLHETVFGGDWGQASSFLAQED